MNIQSAGKPDPGSHVEEMERRRAIVRSAFRSNAMEGLRPNPACQPVFDVFIAGEIELDEMMPRVKSILGIQQATWIEEQQS